MPIVRCQNCNKFTYKRPYNLRVNKRGVFCSHRCADEHFRNQFPEATFTCLNCGKISRRTPAQVRREKTHFCSNDCILKYQRTPRPGKVGKDGYRYMVGMRGNIREHRWVMEKHLGRKLLKDEQIHHINGIRTDNRIENLTVMSNSDHHRLHALIKNPNPHHSTSNLSS